MCVTPGAVWHTPAVSFWLKCGSFTLSPSFSPSEKSQISTLLFYFEKENITIQSQIIDEWAKKKNHLTQWFCCFRLATEMAKKNKKTKILSPPFACPAKRSLCDVTKRTDTSASQALAPYSEAALLFCCSCCFILPLSFKGKLKCGITSAGGCKQRTKYAVSGDTSILPDRG